MSKNYSLVLKSGGILHLLKITVKALILVAFFLSISNSYSQTCKDYSVSPGTTITTDGGVTYNTTIPVGDTYIISDVHVTINVSHTYNADLDIF